MVYNAHVHKLTVSLHVRAGALTNHDLHQNWWLRKELYIELLKSKSREFPRCV